MRTNKYLFAQRNSESHTDICHRTLLPTTAPATPSLIDWLAGRRHIHLVWLVDHPTLLLSSAKTSKSARINNLARLSVPACLNNLSYSYVIYPVQSHFSSQSPDNWKSRHVLLESHNPVLMKIHAQWTWFCATSLEMGHPSGYNAWQ